MTLALSRGDSLPEAFKRDRGRYCGGATPGTRLCKRTDVERIYAEFLTRIEPELSSAPM